LQMKSPIVMLNPSLRFLHCVRGQATGRLREASHEIFYSSPGSTPAQDDILGRVNPKTVLYDALNKMQDKECPSESCVLYPESCIPVIHHISPLLSLCFIDDLNGSPTILMEVLNHGSEHGVFRSTWAIFVLCLA